MNVDVDEPGAWRKSSYSSGEGGQCVEVATLPHVIHVRDSKDISRTAIPVAAVAWTAFLGFAVQ
ncbi:DUF397 domain-containing protein [Streptomyces sp. NPDC005017]|uniref:DUF397 domain-containing protein n=1 Tax=Streptomyces sp. NPDC005017 TaxID=3364706 RepID=UPI0036C209C4